MSGIPVQELNGVLSWKTQISRFQVVHKLEVSEPCNRNVSGSGIRRKDNIVLLICSGANIEANTEQCGQEGKTEKAKKN